MNRNEKLVASRYIPKGSYAIRSKRSSAVVYMLDSLHNSGRPVCCAMGFVGNSKNNSFHHSFKSAERRATFVRGWLIDQDAREARKADSKAAKAAKMSEPQKHLAVGDVLRCSWGYDQTNIDFFEVTALVGKRMVEIRKIGADSEISGIDSGRCVPLKGRYIGEPLRKIVSESGSVRIYSFASAYKMESKKVGGIECFESSHYSWGH